MQIRERRPPRSALLCIKAEDRGERCCIISILPRERSTALQGRRGRPPWRGYRLHRLSRAGTGTKFLLTKFLITKFLITKFLITKFLSNKVPNTLNS